MRGFLECSGLHIMQLESLLMVTLLHRGAVSGPTLEGKTQEEAHRAAGTCADHQRHSAAWR